MYAALLECVTTPGQDGMRFALFLITLSVLKGAVADATIIAVAVTGPIPGIATKR